MWLLLAKSRYNQVHNIYLLIDCKKTLTSVWTQVNGQIINWVYGSFMVMILSQNYVTCPALYINLQYYLTIVTFKNYITYLVGGACLPQRMTCWSQFFASTVWVMWFGSKNPYWLSHPTRVTSESRCDQSWDSGTLPYLRTQHCLPCTEAVSIE